MCDQRQAICMPLNGKVQCIDACIHHIIAALNAGGVWTVGSCCGHDGKDWPMGRIDLDDGRVLLVASKEQADALCPVFITQPAGTEPSVPEGLRALLLWQFGTTDPALLAEMWGVHHKVLRREPLELSRGYSHADDCWCRSAEPSRKEEEKR